MFKNTYISKNLSKLQAAMLIGLCVTMLYCLYCEKMQQNISEKILRLHVVANSDSAEDQRIKLCVRDAVLEVFSQKNAESFAEAEKNAENMLDELKIAAENTDLVEKFGIRQAPTLVIAAGDDFEKFKGVSDIKGYLNSEKAV